MVDLILPTSLRFSRLRAHLRSGVCSVFGCHASRVRLGARVVWFTRRVVFASGFSMVLACDPLRRTMTSRSILALAVAVLAVTACVATVRANDMEEFEVDASAPEAVVGGGVPATDDDVPVPEVSSLAIPGVAGAPSHFHWCVLVVNCGRCSSSSGPRCRVHPRRFSLLLR